MSNEIENKFGSIPAQPEEFSFYDTIPESIAKRVYGLKALQAEQHALEKQLHLEILALEKKYTQLYEPIFKKRFDIVNGETEPSAEDITKGKVIAEEDENGIPKKGPKPDFKEYKGIPEFWLSCFKNNVALAEIITERDEEALVSLTDITVVHHEEQAYKLIFKFAENEFFTNETLEKVYYFKQQEPAGTLAVDRAEGTAINWKEGKDLTVTTKARKQRNKDTNQTRIVKTTEPTDSFFNFFTPKNPPAESVNDIDAEEFEEFESQIEQDFEIAEEIKEKIVPHAVDWYTGKALEYEGLDFDADEFDGEGYEYGSSEDENQVEELDDDVAVGPKGEAEPECKQQ